MKTFTTLILILISTLSFSQNLQMNIYSVNNQISIPLSEIDSITYSEIPIANLNLIEGSDTLFCDLNNTSLSNIDSNYGIKHLNNSATSVIIGKLEEFHKLVILTPMEFQDIENNGDLAAAVDASNGATSYTGVSATLPSQTYGDVIATRVNNVYYMILINESVIIGDTIQIFINYKKTNN